MHTHKWMLGTMIGAKGEQTFAACLGCPTEPNRILDQNEIERRLNAVEMLTAEQAYSIGKEGPRGETAIDPLLAYSSILEGETT